MKKSSFLAGVTLLFASLFTTSCKEIMSNLDQPVSSYLSVADTSVVLNLDTVYKIEVNTINSDGTISYKCSDESIATVDANGLVTPVGNKEGDVVVTVSITGNEYYNAGEQKVKIAVKQPLTFEALEDGQIYLMFWNNINLEKPIVVTTNRTTKKEYTGSTYITVKKGDKLQFESANDHTATDYNYLFVAIRPQTKCAVYGNVMSMISPDGNYHTNKTITKDYALARLLYGYRYWDTDHYEYYTVQHEKYNLMVPATKLTNYCYAYMFTNTGITKAPELPATDLAAGCYYSMFYNCTSLKSAPSLLATKLEPYCYYQMFRDCSELSGNVELPAKKLEPYCYYLMFYNCKKLSKVTCMAEEMTGYNSLSYWLTGAGTDESITERTFVRNTNNKKWMNDDGWSMNPDQWYVPTSWTIEPEIIKTIVLVPGVWDLDNARFAAYVWRNTPSFEEHWYLFSKENDKWTTNIPATYTGLVLVRLNDGTEVNWKSKWNQTSDIDFTNVADNSTISITGWGGGDNPDPYTITAP